MNTVPRLALGTLVLAVIAMLLLPFAALSYRWSLLSLAASFNLLGGAVLLAMVLLPAATWLLLRARRAQQQSARNRAAFALLLCTGLLAFVGVQVYKGFSVPPIHDITTDGVDVPEFDVVTAMRGEGSNSLVYGSGSPSREAHWALQHAAYPDVTTRYVAADPATAFERSLAVLKAQGFEVVNVDRSSGRIEAVATTFWFGFKDDVVVRVRAGAAGTAIDLRSVSRVGQSDLGANAARILRFLAAIGD